MQRKLWLAPVALLLAGCTKNKQIEPVVQVVRAGVVQQIHPDAPERYSASIEPFQKVDLAFKSGGIVKGILQMRGADGRMRNVDVGDKIRAGAELAQVRPLDYEHSLDQAEAQRALAEAQRAQAEAQLSQAQAQLAKARANFNTSGIEYTRARNLFETASLIKPKYDEAKGRYDADAATVAAAEGDVTAAQAGVKAAQAGVANARAAAQQASLSLSDATLRAPFAGWVTARKVDRGSLVGSSTIGFSIQDTHLVKATFGVPDYTRSVVRLGEKERVELDALQRGFTGVITSISPQADPKTRVFSIEVTLENSRENIRPGMIGSITLGGEGDLRPRTVVPLSAIVRAPADPNGFAVFLLTGRNGKSYACAQRIEIGDTFGNSIEVKSGLAPGQRIITLGAAQVREGQQVSVIP